MTRSVVVYGFGSAFEGRSDARDFDFLIVHQDTNIESCLLAISCKARITEFIERAHVTMLSAEEVAYFRFIETAKAVRLGIVRESQFEGDIKTLNIKCLAQKSS